MARFQKVNPEGREAIRARERELRDQDLDQRNKQSEQWKTQRLLNKHVKKGK